MYHSKEAGELLKSVVDVYLADFRYGNNRCAEKYSNVKKYIEIVKRNFKKAYQQSEIILRHLVLPEHLECCSKPTIEWTAETIPDVRFNLMFQYTPYCKAHDYPEINRRVMLKERKKAIQTAKDFNIKDLLV
ncbi:MAG: hypothetical protein ACLFMM_01755 [Methanohalobium sp.]|uniref:hypothetical protein n=1 Tax=Methanohalobium sp. TaxID=2837493 RepID=UPI00397C5660